MKQSTIRVWATTGLAWSLSAAFLDLTLSFLPAPADLSHLAATPVGLIIRTEVEVIAIDGKRVEFAFTAFDEREKVAEGTHERYVTDRPTFLGRLEEKLAT